MPISIFYVSPGLLNVYNLARHPLSVCVLTDEKVSLVVGVLFDSLQFEKKDPRYCIKFCVKDEIKCAARTLEMLTVTFGESTISRTQVQLYYN